MMDRPSSDFPGDFPANFPGRAGRPPPLPAGTGGSARRGDARRTPPRRRAPRWLSLLGYGALAVGCLGAGAAAFLVVAAPLDLVRDRIAERVKARSGLDLTVGGGTSLSLFPRPSLSLGEVALSAPESGGTPILTAARFDAEVSVWSLFGARPAVDRITVHGPVIELSPDILERPPGRPRRTAESSDAAPPSDTPGDTPPAAAEPGSESAAARHISRLGAGTLQIVDGTVRYRGRDGELTEATSLQLTLSADAPSSPLTIDGSVTVRNAPISLSGTISPAEALATRQPARVAIKLSGPPFEGGYEGSLSLAGGLSLNGALKLEARSLEALSAWLGRPLTAGGGADGMVMTANLQSSRERLSLSNMRATFGDTTASGTLTLEANGARRRLSGSLEVSELDFGRLLLKSSARRRDAERAGSATGSVIGPPPAAAPLPPSQARARREAHDWSDEPINVSMLGVLDVALAITAQRITYKDLKTGRSSLTLALEGGAGSVRLEDVQLYGGRAQGMLTLDGSGDVLVTGANLKLDGVDLHQLLTGALDFPWIEGRASLAVALAGQGATERQIVEGLNGKVEMLSRDGAIAGADLGKIVRSIQNVRMPRLSLSPAEKTPYSELAATFAVTNGIAANKDLRLTGPHLQLNGDGTLDLGQRRIDYTMRTKVGATPDPGATLKLGEIDVPVTIIGPWDKPAFGIKGQEQLTDTVKQIGKNLRSRDVKDALRGLLQGDGEKRVKPRDLLDKLLKKD